MIAIINTGSSRNSSAPDERIYELKINHEIITTFKHKRNDGLAVCLQKASEAVAKWEATRDRRQNEELREMFDLLTQIDK